MFPAKSGLHLKVIVLILMMVTFSLLQSNRIVLPQMYIVPNSQAMRDQICENVKYISQEIQLSQNIQESHQVQNITQEVKFSQNIQDSHHVQNVPLVPVQRVPSVNVEVKPRPEVRPITMFTTFSNLTERFEIQRAVLYNWKAVIPDAHLVLFESPGTDILVSIAKKLGWNVHPVPRVNYLGFPYIKEMYKEAFKLYKSHLYGYTNGDILFDNSLMFNIKFIVAHVKMSNVKPMLVGQRTNVYLADNITVYDSKSVTKASETGEYALKTLMDYFIMTPAGFPWQQYPDLVIGRTHWDATMIALAVKAGLQTIDCTKTLVAVHQSYNGTYNSGLTGEGQDVNKDNADSIKLLTAKDNCQETECTSHFTRYIPKLNRIIIVRRSAPPRRISNRSNVKRPT